MSQSASSIIFVPYRFLCPNHNKEVNHLNLTPDHPKEKRLLCQKCNYNGQNNLMHINDVYQFLTELNKKSSQISQNIEAMFKRYQDAKQQINTYIDYIGNQFEVLKKNIESNKTIKDGILKKYLSKESKNNIDDLINLITIISANVILTDDNIQLKKDFYPQQEQEIAAKLDQGVDLLSNIVTNLPKMAVEAQNNEQILQSRVKVQKSLVVKNYQKSNEIDFKAKIYAISFNRSGQLLAIGGSKVKDHDCFLQIWKVNEQNQVTLFSSLKGHKRDVKAICFSQIDDSLLSGGVDNSIIYWKQQNQYDWANCQTLEGHELAVSCIKFNHFENFIASASQELIIWQKDLMNNNQWVQQFKFVNQNQILCLSFNEDGRFLVSGTADMFIHFFQWKGAEWSLNQTIQDQEATFTFVSFITSNTFVTAQSDNQMKFWSYSSQDQEFVQQVSIQQNQLKAVNYCESRRLLVISYDDQTTINQISNTNEIKLIQALPVKSNCLSLQSDATQIAIALDGKLNIYQELDK